MKHLSQIRQGDVLLQKVLTLPHGCTELPPSDHRIVLAYGEVTGHAHAIYDHLAKSNSSNLSAAEITLSLIARMKAKARLLVSHRGERYLVVTEAVNLQHEEHASQLLEPGIYHLPHQVEYTPASLFNVED